MADISSILEAVKIGLAKVKAISDIGDNFIPSLSALTTAITVIEKAISVGEDVTTHVAAIKRTYEPDGTPTQAMIDALNVEIAELEGRVFKPLGPADEGEPE